MALMHMYHVTVQKMQAYGHCMRNMTVLRPVKRWLSKAPGSCFALLWRRVAVWQAARQKQKRPPQDPPLEYLGAANLNRCVAAPLHPAS